MKHWILRFWSAGLPTILSLLLSACASQPGHHGSDQLVFRIPHHVKERWKVSAIHNEPNAVVVERLRNDENPDEWRQMVISESHEKAWAGGGVEQALAVLQQQREKACQKPFEWKILKQESGSIIYEGRSRSCAGSEPAYEIGRIVDGGDTRFRLAFLSRDSALPTDERAKWLTMLQEAAIRAGNK